MNAGGDIAAEVDISAVSQPAVLERVHPQEPWMKKTGTIDKAACDASSCTVIFKIKYGNTGTAKSSALQVVDTVDSTYKVDSVTPTPGSTQTTATGKTYTFQLGAIPGNHGPSNPAGTITIKTHVNLTNCAQLQAAAAGTLQRTDYDDPAAVARRANQHVAPSKFAQHVKAVFVGS